MENTCKKCKVKLIIGVNITQSQINNSDNKCKECRKTYVQQHYTQNKDRYVEINKLWKVHNKDLDKKIREDYYVNNKDKHKNWAEDWKENNYERHKKYKREWHREYLKDPLNKLKESIRKHIHRGLKENKDQSSLNIIGLNSWNELKHYLENQFTDGMNWDNWGRGKNNSKWHIDHIISLSSAKTKEDIHKLSHYTNLKPMWCSDNIRKSNKM
jgi:hypothetical protein